MKIRYKGNYYSRYDYYEVGDVVKTLDGFWVATKPNMNSSDKPKFPIEKTWKKTWRLLSLMPTVINNNKSKAL